MTMLRTVEIFLRQTGMSPTRFGRDAVRDPRIVLDMRKGREPSERMCRRLNLFIARHSDLMGTALPDKAMQVERPAQRERPAQAGQSMAGAQA